MISPASDRPSLAKPLRAAVIGAGPAGCAAARAVTRAGLDVVLLERGRPGKDKACGDAFAPSAVTLLASHGIDRDAIVALGGHQFTGTDLYRSDSTRWRLSAGAGWVIPRAALDQRLRDMTAQHVPIDYGAAVSEITRQPAGGFILSLRHDDATATELACDAVILATGSSNRLSAQWGIAGAPIMAASISC